MKQLIVITILIFGLAAASAADASKPAAPAKPKKVDPAFAPITDNPKLPRVLLIGDSISVGYTLPVRELLQGKANVHRIPENGSSTGYGLEKLPLWVGYIWFGDSKWDVIHFNWGLHDLKYLDENGKYVTPDKGKQVSPLPVYEKNLRELVTKLKASGAKLIWCSTTPVPEGSAGRVKDSEIEYNRVAEQVMKENGVAIDDLHALAASRLAEIQQPKNVHFTPEGYKALAQQVAACIEAALPKR